MSPKFNEIIVTVMSDALHEINEVLGYENFKQDMIKQISENFLLWRNSLLKLYYYSLGELRTHK